MAVYISAPAFKDLFETPRRFPLASIFALALIICYWHLFDPWPVNTNLTYPVPRQVPTRADIGRNLLGWFLFSAFVWTFAVGLLGESRSWKAGLLAAFVGLIAIAFTHNAGLALQYLLHNPSEPVATASLEPLVLREGGGLDLLSRKLLTAGLLLLPFLAPFTRLSDEPGAFWQFAHRLVVACLAGAAGAALAYGGLWAILATIRLLFAVDIPDRIILAKAGVIAIFGIAPAIWLALTPREFQDPPQQGKDKEFTSKAVALLVKFILIPAGSVLSAILAVYIVKVIADGSFATARLGYRGLLYGSGIVLVALMAYPERDDSPIVRAFWRAWPWLMMPPTVLALFAIKVRVAEYGWSQSRYLAFLTGLWLAFIMVTTINPRLRGDLRLIPGLFAALLVFSSFGPWGAAAVIGRSQAERLIALFEHGGVVENSVWTATSAPQWSQPDRLAIWSGLHELEITNQLWRLRSLFQDANDNPFASATADVSQALRSRIGAPGPAYPIAGPMREFGRYSLSTPLLIRVGDSYLIGPNSLQRSAKSNVTLPFGRVDFVQSDLVVEVRVSFTGANVTKTRRFDLAQFRDALFDKKAASEQNVIESEARSVEGEGDADVILKVTNLSFPLDGKLEPMIGTYYAIVPAKP
jgi:Domain of unknown function (DUF4153)